MRYRRVPTKKHRKLIRACKVPLEYVMDKIPDPLHRKGKAKQKIYGYTVTLNSKRLTLFKLKGITCVTCGIKGEFYAIERDRLQTKYHLNLYAIDKEGDEVLMTKDHIYPKSKGGSDRLDNLQTMCKVCNEIKNDNYEVFE